MPRRQTINPLTIKTGDYVYLPGSLKNYQEAENAISTFEFRMCAVRMYVSEIHEFITSLDVTRSKRDFKFILVAEKTTPLGPQNRFVVTERAPMFRTLEALEEWMHMEVKRTCQKLEEHDDRQVAYTEAKLVPKTIE